MRKIRKLFSSKMICAHQVDGPTAQDLRTLPLAAVCEHRVISTQVAERGNHAAARQLDSHIRAGEHIFLAAKCLPTRGGEHIFSNFST